jgi:hypothetical protein
VQKVKSSKFVPHFSPLRSLNDATHPHLPSPFPFGPCIALVHMSEVEAQAQVEAQPQVGMF